MEREARRIGVDPDSDTPLYHQIAGAIRARIEAGGLAPGDSLEPLREAAETWGVNLHTVRHAYASLARDGLVEMRRGPGGTRVRPDLPADAVADPPVPVPDALESFAEEIVGRGRREFGLGPVELAELIREVGASPTERGVPAVWVVECSRWQCEAHAREIMGRWRVEARPWVLEETDGPPPGPAIATYFHFNELRRRWPRSFGGLHFVDLRVDSGLAPVIRDPAVRALVCERDEPTARAVIADLLSLVSEAEVEIEPRVTEEADALIREASGKTRIFCPPRVWARLGRTSRSDPRAVEIRYLLDDERLNEVAAELGWTASAAPSGSSGGPG